MRPSVVLHIGLEKTGTKSIQYWLRDHEHLLAERGMRFPRGWLRLNVHQELPLCIMREDRMCGPREAGDEWRDPVWRRDVLDQVRDDLRAHPNETTILSSENLGLLRYDDEFELLHDVVGEAEIVVYLREPIDWLFALRDQYTHKNTVNAGLSSDPDAYNYLGPGTWRTDYDELLRNYGSWFPQVWVADYDRENAYDGSVVPSFLRHLRLPTVDAEHYRLNARDMPTPRTNGNRSLGLRFGQERAHEGGRLRSTSMPSN